MLALAGQLSSAQAVELGEVNARSFAGQPLVADIELTSLANPNTPVQVELASRDVYLAANVAMTPVLSGLAMVVERRGARQVLHIRSTKVVDAPHVHLFFELTEGGSRVVRTATVWLVANPNRTQPAVAAPAVVKPKPALALVRARTPQARDDGAAPAAPAAAVAPADNEAGLRYQNGVLNAKLTEVEEKMKQLQTSLGVQPDAAPAPTIDPLPAPVARAAPVAKPPPASAAKSAQAVPVKKSRWFWIGLSGLVLLVLAAGGALFWVLRRNAHAQEEEVVEGGGGPSAGALTAFWHRLRERLRRKHWAEGTDLPGQASSA